MTAHGRLALNAACGSQKSERGGRVTRHERGQRGVGGRRRAQKGVGYRTPFGRSRRPTVPAPGREGGGRWGWGGGGGRGGRSPPHGGSGGRSPPENFFFGQKNFFFDMSKIRPPWGSSLDWWPPQPKKIEKKSEKNPKNIGVAPQMIFALIASTFFFLAGLVMSAEKTHNKKPPPPPRVE